MKRLCAMALVVFATPAFAADQATATAALAAATQAEDQAATLGNRWVPAEAALKSARDAQARQDWDTTLAEATQARALANRAIEQAQEQKTLWRDAVIR